MPIQVALVIGSIVAIRTTKRFFPSVDSNMDFHIFPRFHYGTAVWTCITVSAKFNWSVLERTKEISLRNLLLFNLFFLNLYFHEIFPHDFYSLENGFSFSAGTFETFCCSGKSVESRSEFCSKKPNSAGLYKSRTQDAI